MDALKEEGKEEELRMWASFRGQTLSRTGDWKWFWNICKTKYDCPKCNIQYILFGVTVRGMMYYREALKLQAFLDLAENKGI